jgi:outer membrane lipoprotein-sorting protein
MRASLAQAVWVIGFLLSCPVARIAFTPDAYAAGAGAPSVQAIVQKLDDLYRSSSSIGHIEPLSKTETQTRHLKMRMWSKGIRDKTLIIIDEPAREAGTATLKVGQNLWNYLPKISRTIRIPPSMMLSSWMGTDFTNDDLVKDTSYQDDFTASAPVPSETPPGWTVTMTVKPGIVGRWAKIEWTVSDGKWLPVEAKFYDRKGRLARTIKYSDIKELGGRELPTRMTLDSVDQPGHQTEIHFLDMKFNANVPDSRFSLSELERR